MSNTTPPAWRPHDHPAPRPITAPMYQQVATDVAGGKTWAAREMAHRLEALAAKYEMPTYGEALYSRLMRPL